MANKLTIKDIEDRGLLLYRYIRGSQAYGLATETSDTDYGSVYACPPEQMLGMGLDFQDEILEDNNNDAAFSLKKFCQLLLKSNPTILESLWIPEECIIYESPIIKELKKHRYEFLTKACFPAFSGYAKSQYKNARNTKKKVYEPITERLGILDFAYTYHKQGSSKIENWLYYRNLNQMYIGCVNIPNMIDNYGLYYDWGMYFQNDGITAEMLCDAYRDNTEYDTIKLVKEMKEARANDNEELASKKEALLKKATFKNMVSFIINHYNLADDDTLIVEDSLIHWYNNQKPIGYKGLVRVMEDGSHDRESQQLRLSSVSKGEVPICHISYNEAAYSQHCRAYNDYQTWFKNKNEHRWTHTKERGYDAKALCSALRIIRLAKGICQDKEFYIDRTNIDREFLLQVKRGELPLDEVLEYLNKDIKEMDEAMKVSDLPDNIDADKLNEWLVGVQSDFTKQWLESKNNG